MANIPALQLSQPAGNSATETGGGGLASGLTPRLRFRQGPPLVKQVQPQHAAACRSTPFLELHMGVLKHAAACCSIHFFAFMSLSTLLFSLSDDHALLAMLSKRSV